MAMTTSPRTKVEATIAALGPIEERIRGTRAINCIPGELEQRVTARVTAKLSAKKWRILQALP
jgi:hypothetical protein